MKRLFSIITALTIILVAKSQNPLLIPDTLSGTNIGFTLQTGTVQFLPGTITQTMGANGNILGPTLMLNKGDFVNFSVNNQLMDTTTIHWHGLHVSSENDGGPHTVIIPNSTWQPAFTIMDRAATYWYHSHLHHMTDMHVSKGIAGMIIVRDNDERALTLPRTYGIDDMPLVIQTKDLDANNQIIAHSNSDDVLMTNATIDPEVDLPAQVIRLRVLNGSSQRAFNLGLTANQTLFQITSDGGLLSAPFTTTRVLLAPGERAEILVNLAGMEGQTIYLKSYASELPNGIYGATNPGMGAGMTMTGYNPNPLNGTDFDILKINITAQTANPVTSVPATLIATNPWNPANVDLTRNLTFTPVTMGPNQLNGEFLINGTAFNMGVINYTIPLNNIEIWELFNQSGIAHPFHIHDVQFNILSRNGNPPAANEQGWKDVVLVKPQETVRFITKFEDFANDSVPYMYHCHLLKHEDGGMMGQFVVKDFQTENAPTPFASSFNIYPNPSTGKLQVESPTTITALEIRDALGRKINAAIQLEGNKASIQAIPTGIFFLRIITPENTISQKIIVE